MRSGLDTLAKTAEIGEVVLEDWSRVAAALTARMGERGISQRELSEMSGVSTATLREMERGADRRRSSVTLSAIERALGWPDGHLRMVLRGKGEGDAGTGTDEVTARVAALEGELRQAVAKLDARISALEAGR